MRKQALVYSLIVTLASLAAGGVPSRVLAADPPASGQAANEQIVEPKVDRRPIFVPRLPSRDFEVGGFVGTYATEIFGTNRVAGLRIGYHFTEDIFFSAAYGRTKVRDESLRQVLPNGLFARPQETMTYTNLSAGFNVLPGEVFIGGALARPSGLYLIGGLGSTELVGEKHHTVNFGLGLRLFLKDWAAIQVDMRDHIFALDVLGRRRSTQNLELTLGATFYF